MEFTITFAFISIVLSALMYWTRPNRPVGPYRYPHRALYLTVKETAAVPGGSKTFVRHAIFFPGPPTHRFALAPNRTWFWNVKANVRYFKTGGPGLADGHWIAVSDSEDSEHTSPSRKTRTRHNPRRARA